MKESSSSVTPAQTVALTVESPDSKVRKTFWQWPVFVLLAVLACVVLGWQFIKRPEIRFLDWRPTQPWVVYPSPFQIQPQPLVRLTTTFLLPFQLNEKPNSGLISVSAFQLFELNINHSHVFSSQEGDDWKTIQEIPITEFLHSGQNLIEFKVHNESGPPALSAQVKIDDQVFKTGEQWQASLVGATPFPAVEVSQAYPVHSGNFADGGPGTIEAFQSRWGVMLLLLLVCACIEPAVRYAIGDAGQAKKTWRYELLVFGFVGLIGLVLILSNSAILTRAVGYDATAHLDYISFIQREGRLPFANEGWEAHQPPLHYLVSAGFLSAFTSRTDISGQVLALRLLNWFWVLLSAWLAGRAAKQWLPQLTLAPIYATLFVLVLPMNLCLAHSTSNDLPAIAISIASIAICLHVLKREEISWKWPLLLGVILGLGILTKLTSLPTMMAVGFVLSWKAWCSKNRVQAFGKFVLLPLSACVLICGWFFIRNYIHFGRPLVGSFDADTGFRWWQHPGFGCFTQVLQFGDVLKNPYYAFRVGVWDGFYATLFSDGGWSGTSVDGRPPWNYGLMTITSCMSLIPLSLVLLGGFSTAWKAVCDPRLDRVLLLLSCLLAVAACAYQFLKYPYYCHVKSWYLTAAVLPVCLFACEGISLVTANSRWRQRGLNAFLLTWACSSLFSYAIVIDSPEAGLWQVMNERGLQPSSVTEYGRLHEKYPDDPEVAMFLAMHLSLQNKDQDAVALLEPFAQGNKPDVDLWSVYADSLLKLGRDSEALGVLDRLKQLQPDNTQYSRLLANYYSARKEFESVEEAIRLSLRNSPVDGGLHVDLSEVLFQRDSPAEGIEHLRHAVRYSPRPTDAISRLVFALSTISDDSLRRPEEAISLSEQMMKSASKPEAVWLRSLAAALASQGNFTASLNVIANAKSFVVDPNAKIMKDLLQDEAIYQSGNALRLGSRDLVR